MLNKIAWVVAVVFSAGASLSSTGHIFDWGNLNNHFGMMFAIWQAGGLHMFDHFGFRQFQIDHLSRLSKDK